MNVIRNITRSRTCHKIIQRLRSSDVYEPPYLAVKYKLFFFQFNKSTVDNFPIFVIFLRT